MTAMRTFIADVIYVFERLILSGRWVIIPLYLGLLAVLGVYVWHSLVDVWHLVTHHDITEADLIMAALGVVDATMVANLIVFVTTGSYAIFVRPFEATDAPTWLTNITSGTLKIKTSTSIVGISLIGLLHDFFSADSLSVEALLKHAGLHLVFLLSALAMTVVDNRTPHASAPTHR